VVLSVGYEPYVPFKDVTAKNVHVIGDANRVGNLLTVIEQAYDLAYRL
jgi:2-enoate reductase